MSNNPVISASYFNAKVQKLDAPFDIYKFDCKDVISVTDALKLREALLTMNFKKKSCDLYSFSQSADFKRLASDQIPEELKRYLSILDMIKQRIAVYLKKKFNKMISVSCSKYDQGDYLLCHDDCVDDRSVAFIYYLNCNWLKDWGGTLDVYSVDENLNAKEITQSINPGINNLVFFPVGHKTYHQVSENLSKFSRISINGWFHCDDLAWEVCQQKTEVVSPFYMPLKLSESTNKILNLSLSALYKEELFREAMNETYQGETYLLCNDFFTQNVVNNLSNEIFTDNLQWKTKGPANKRQFNYLPVEDLPDHLLFIVNMLRSEFMMNFLKESTGLECLAVNTQVQKWQGGHYIVSGGNDGLNSFNVLSAYMFFTQCFEDVSDVGKDTEDLHYMFEERDARKFGCKPQNNTLFLVRRTPNSESYVKYCQKISGFAWTVVMAHYLIKDSFNPRVICEKMN